MPFIYTAMPAASGLIGLLMLLLPSLVLAEENKSLQDRLTGLITELEELRREVDYSMTESEREVVLDKISDMEKHLRQLRSNEKSRSRRQR